MLIPLLLAVAMLVCSVTDIIDRRIPNAVTFPLAGAALAVNVAGWIAGRTAAEVLGAVGPSASLAGLAACFGVMLANHLFAGHGAGDVKLAAGMGACLGLESGILALAYAYVVAGVLATGMLIAGRWRRSDPTQASRGVPLAPCLAAGAGLAWLGPPAWRLPLAVIAGSVP